MKAAKWKFDFIIKDGDELLVVAAAVVVVVVVVLDADVAFVATVATVTTVAPVVCAEVISIIKSQS
jgi:hypothetical protein